MGVRAQGVIPCVQEEVRCCHLASCNVLSLALQAWENPRGKRANPLAPKITVSYGPNSSLLPALSELFAVSIHEKV